MATIAEKIIEVCKSQFPMASTTCNGYVGAVAKSFFTSPSFDPSKLADDIIDQLNNSADWTKLGTSNAKAIADAKANKFVIAGMIAEDLEADHGHLAIVIGMDGALSGTVIVPICYAGSLKTEGRVQNQRISSTFPTSCARNEEISYYSRATQISPA